MRAILAEWRRLPGRIEAAERHEPRERPVELREAHVAEEGQILDGDGVVGAAVERERAELAQPGDPVQVRDG